MSRDGGQPSLREGLSEYGSILEYVPFVRIEAVEASRDERVKRLGHLQRLHGSGDPERAVLSRQQPPVDEHAHSLDGVERDALGTFPNLISYLCREAGSDPVDQLLARFVREGLENHRMEVPPAGAPGRPAFQQFRPRKRQDQDRIRARPFEQVLDEIEQACVGPVEVLEHRNERLLRRQELDEAAPRREEILLICRPALGEAEKMCEPRLDPGTLVGIGDMGLDACPQFLERRRGKLFLENAGARPNHLGKSPVGDTLAVGEAAAAVPPHVVDKAVDVLLELPGEPRLPDSGDPDDR